MPIDSSNQRATIADLEARLTQWVLSPERFEQSHEMLLDDLAAVLDGAGLRLATASVLVRTIHPQFEMFAQRWRPRAIDEIVTESSAFMAAKRTVEGLHGMVDVYLFSHGHGQEEIYRGSPFHAAEQAQEILRSRLHAGDDPKMFPVLEELEAIGVTDYLVFPLHLQKPFAVGLAFSSSHPEGFPEGIEVMWQRLTPLLSALMAFRMERLSSSEILAAYLGRTAAKRVLRGQVVLGQIEAARSVVGFVDLTGYGELIPNLDERSQSSILDVYFRATYASVTRARGEILKFMGESVLFVFPLDKRDDRQACQQAVAAGRAIVRAVSEHPVIKQFGLTVSAALHMGDVLLGNAGAPGRLDFTVLGDAVNLAARLQRFGSSQGQPLVVSAEVGAQLESPPASLGFHTLKGIKTPQEVLVPNG